MKSLTIAITIWGVEPDKMCSLIEVMRILHQQMRDGFEILFVEQSSCEYPLWNGFCDMIGARHVYIGDHYKYPMYRRSWMRNVAVRQAESDLVLFIDDDAIFGDNYIESLVDNFESDYLLGWDEILSLTPKATKKYYTERKYRIDWQKGDICYKHRVQDNSAWGSVVLFDRNFYINVLGGENEEYQGWGFRDRDVHNRCMWLTGEDKFYTYTHLHLSHRRNREALFFNLQNERMLKAALEHPREITDMLLAANSGNIDEPVEISWRNLGV